MKESPRPDNQNIFSKKKKRYFNYLSQIDFSNSQNPYSFNLSRAVSRKRLRVSEGEGRLVSEKCMKIYIPNCKFERRKSLEVKFMRICGNSFYSKRRVIDFGNKLSLDASSLNSFTEIPARSCQDDVLHRRFSDYFTTDAQKRSFSFD